MSPSPISTIITEVYLSYISNKTVTFLNWDAAGPWSLMDLSRLIFYSLESRTVYDPVLCNLFILSMSWWKLPHSCLTSSLVCNMLLKMDTSCHTHEDSLLPTLFLGSGLSRCVGWLFIISGKNYPVFPHCIIRICCFPVYHGHSFSLNWTTPETTLHTLGFCYSNVPFLI